MAEHPHFLDEEWEEYSPASGLSFRDFVIAGSFAGVSEHLFMYPVDTLKVSPR